MNDIIFKVTPKYDSNALNEKIQTAIKRLLGFLHPQVCRHAVVLDLLNIMEECGCELNKEFVKAVVEADDDKALQMIWESEKP